MLVVHVVMYSCTVFVCSHLYDQSMYSMFSVCFYFQNIREISKAVKDSKHKTMTKRILVHTDAAQAIGKIIVDVTALGVDYLTIVGHKVYLRNRFTLAVIFSSPEPLAHGELL